MRNRELLVLSALSCLLLAACPRHEPLLCGVEESCPRGFACSEGVCVKDSDPECPDGGCPVTRCPAEPPGDEESIEVAVDLVCNYGEVTCCGVTKPAKTCTAAAGEVLGCFTDWCFTPQPCEDAGAGG
jgi:hypothetical protein